MLLPTTIILLLSLSLTAAEFRDAAVNASSPRVCYSCEGINCQRTTRQDVSKSCNDLLDICVTVYEGFMVSERGCFLELSLAAQAKCAGPSRECQKCSGALCNNKGRADFQCLQCIGSENANCNAASVNLTPTQCAAPTARNSYCYVKSVGVHLQRGCALSLREQKTCLEDLSCSLCLPENAYPGGACNNYQLEIKSGAQQLLGLSLGVLSLVALLTLH
ncbi:CG4377 [Drosophila busckii]|uniref:CG4377 n=1 Tax=Drosophila busckii TaxID=30019 RepID=A0A0M4EU98_DROBS|nr:uncharacterized protein LOC108595016 [Drosophila busckii]ALC40957.1 CG4377 [Drosophila busckii]